MSRSAKALFLGSVIFSGVSIWGVHMIQVRERETMYAGVLRDEARLQAKRRTQQQRERELEFDEQRKKRAYLETRQPVSDRVVEPAPVDPSEIPKDATGLDFGCKTC